MPEVRNIESKTACELTEFTADCQRTSQQTGGVATPVIALRSRVWCHIPVVPDAPEADVEGCLEPTESGPVWSAQSQKKKKR